MAVDCQVIRVLFPDHLGWARGRYPARNGDRAEFSEYLPFL